MYLFLLEIVMLSVWRFIVPRGFVCFVVFGFPQQYNILKDRTLKTHMGCKWEHNEKWFPFLDPLVCLNITDCHWKTAASKFEQKGDIVTQNTLNNLRWRGGEWTSHAAGGRAHPGSWRRCLCSFSCGSESSRGGTGGSASQGHRHSILFALILFMSCALLRSPGAAWPFLQAMAQEFAAAVVWKEAEALLQLQECRAAPAPCQVCVGQVWLLGDSMEITPLPFPPALTSVCPLTDEIYAASILWGSK